MVAIDNLNNLLTKSLDNYFNVISHVGCMSPFITLKLISLSAVLFIASELNEYLTEDDINTLDKVLLCLLENCLIDFINSDNNDLLILPNNLLDCINQKLNLF